MKKCLALIVVSIFSSQLHAIENVNKGLEDLGFYVGIEATATGWNIEVDNHFTDPAYQPFTEIAHQDYQDWNWSGLFRAGGYMLWGNDNKWFSAIEFLGEGHDVQFVTTETVPNTQTGVYTQKAEAIYTLGGQLKQGYFIDEDILSFVTVGLVYTQFRLTSSSLNQDNLAIPEIAQIEKFYRPGIRVALGSEYFITDYLGIDLELAYTAYESKTIDIYQETTFIIPITVTKVGEAEFDPSAVSIGLGFNFYTDII